MRSLERAIYLLLMAASVAFCAFLLWRATQDEQACARAGGVLITGHCIDKDSILTRGEK